MVFFLSKPPPLALISYMTQLLDKRKCYHIFPFLLKMASRN